MLSFDLVIPALNEEKTIVSSVNIAYKYLLDNFKDYYWNLIVVDNNSDDQTNYLVRSIQNKYSKLRLIEVEQRGKGNAIYGAWIQSTADIIAYMDADLAVNVSCLNQLIRSINNNTSIVIGSRLLKNSLISRGFIREISSRGYNFVSKKYLQLNISDAQCGFKAILRNKFENIYPLLKERGWFFDTELLFQATRRKLYIEEIPVIWIEGDKSNIRLYKDIPAAIRCFKRIKSASLR